MRPDAELCMTPLECMDPEERRYVVTKPDAYWLKVMERIADKARIEELQAEVKRLRSALGEGTDADV